MATPKTPLVKASLPLTTAAVAFLVLVAIGWPAAAQTPVTIRSGDHRDFGRVVFDAPAGTKYHVVRDGDRLTIEFPADVALQPAPHPPRNVTSLQAAHAEAALTLVPGSTYRAERLGQHIVVDVFDPKPGDSPPPANQPAPMRPRPDARTTRSGGPQPAVQQPRTVRQLAAALQLPDISLPPSAAAPHMDIVWRPSEGPAPSGHGPRLVADTAAAAEPALPLPPPAPAMAPTSATAPPSPEPQSAASGARTREVPDHRGADAAPVVQPPATAAAADRPAAERVGNDRAGNDRAGSDRVAADRPGTDETTFASGDASDQAGPVALLATLEALPPDSKGAAFAVPFAPTTGAAVFQRHGETLIVFDERRPVDLGNLQPDPALRSARVVLLPAGTLIRMTPPPGTAVSLTKTPHGWIVAALAAPPPPAAIAADIADNQLHIAASAPSRVLTVADPETGDPLLVGTQLGPGQGVPMPHRAPQFALLRTEQGVVVAPQADAVAMRIVPDGFAVSVGSDQLALSRNDGDTLGDAAALTRRFAFPASRPDQLLRQLSADIAGAAAVPVLARGPIRRQAALTMISLGMGAEAEAVLQVTAADDPRQAESADVAGLTAIAALLAGRLSEADGIDDPRLTGTDEIALWRALRAGMRDETSRFAATSLAGTAALLLTYPPAIRDRMLPMAAETMVQGGATAAARELLAHAKNAPGLDLARAMLAQATGDADAALRQYDIMAAGHDQLLHARAAVRAIKLRLATHKFDARQAAEALDRLLYAWRGDRRELNLREQLAALRQQLGEWREALTLLRDSERLFPDDAKVIHARLQATFDAMLQGGAADTMPSIAFVALVDENADLVPNTGEGEAMQAKLADRLLALDLPQHAGPVLDKLMRAAPLGVARATYGARLAALRLREDDAAGALAALAASESAELPDALAEQRLLLRADAQARSGDMSAAVSALSGLETAEADAVRAGIFEEAKDWMGAERALTTYAARTVPATGPLTDASQRVLLRLATAAARAGDQPALASLRDREEQRMGTGPLGEMFRLLTEDPVHGPADLPRSGREVGYARALPANLQAMRP